MQARFSAQVPHPLNITALCRQPPLSSWPGTWNGTEDQDRLYVTSRPTPPFSPHHPAPSPLHYSRRARGRFAVALAKRKINAEKGEKEVNFLSAAQYPRSQSLTRPLYSVGEKREGKHARLRVQRVRAFPRLLLLAESESREAGALYLWCLETISQDR